MTIMIIMISLISIATIGYAVYMYKPFEPASVEPIETISAVSDPGSKKELPHIDIPSFDEWCEEHQDIYPQRTINLEADTLLEYYEYVDQGTETLLDQGRCIAQRIVECALEHENPGIPYVNWDTEEEEEEEEEEGEWWTETMEERFHEPGFLDYDDEYEYEDEEEYEYEDEEENGKEDVIAAPPIELVEYVDYLPF